MEIIIKMVGNLLCNYLPPPTLINMVGSVCQGIGCMWTESLPNQDQLFQQAMTGLLCCVCEHAPVHSLETVDPVLVQSWALITGKIDFT